MNKKKFIPFARVKKELRKDDRVKAEYDALAEEYAVLEAFVKARSQAGLSQAEIARRMGTTQSAVARMESGSRLPSLSTLFRYARAAGMRPVISFVPAGSRR